MRLGSETGSFVNHMMSRATRGQPEPEVGMGVTFLRWSDRSAGTIIRLHTDGDTVVAFDCQDDKAIRTDSNGQSECQSYRFERNTNGRVHRFKRDKKGRWREQTMNERMNWVFIDQSQCIRLGERDEYYDFSF